MVENQNSQNDKNTPNTDAEKTASGDTSDFLTKPSTLAKDALERITGLKWIIKEPDDPGKSEVLLNVDRFGNQKGDASALLDYLLKKIGEDSSKNAFLRKQGTKALDREISISMDDINISKVENCDFIKTNMEDFERYQTSRSGGIGLSK